MPKLTQLVVRSDITTEAQAVALRNAILDIGLVAFDTETTGLVTYQDRPVIVSMSLPTVPWNDEWGDQSLFSSKDPNDEPFNLEAGSRFVFEVLNSDVTPILVPSLAEPGVSVVAHNWKYDAHMIHRFWGVLPGAGGRVYETMSLDFLYDENNTHGLKDCCSRYGLMEGLVPFNKLFPTPPAKVLAMRPHLSAAEYAMETDKDRLLDYAATDPYATMMLFEFLRDKLKDEFWLDDTAPDGKKESNLWEYYLKWEEPYVRAIWEMEKNGVYVDPDALKAYLPSMKSSQQKILDHYAREAGRLVDITKPAQLKQLFFNDFGLPVTKRSKKTQEPSLDEDAIDMLIEQGYENFVAPLLEYRAIDKLRSTYVEGLSQHVMSDGLIHGTFNVATTVTGRLSSSAPNVQNIAKKDEDSDEVGQYEIRRAFRAAPGHSLVVADFDTLEVVITAHIAQDKSLITALLGGLDLHAHTAATMFGVKYEDIIAAKKAKEPTKEQRLMLVQRSNAKAIKFGIMYGMGAQSLAARIGVPLKEAEGLIDLYYKTYPGILSSKEYWTQMCRTHGYVLTALNRRRRLPAVNSRYTGVRNRAERQLFNAIIQGTAADLMRSYMPAIAFHPELISLGAKIVLQVHDEVVIQAPDENIARVKEIVDEILRASLKHVPWAVPINATGKICKVWADGK